MTTTTGRLPRSGTWGRSAHAQVLTTTHTGVCVQLMRRTIFSFVSLLPASWSILT